MAKQQSPVNKKNVDEANKAIGEQINLIAALADVMKDVVSQVQNKGELDKGSLDLTRQTLKVTREISSEYQSMDAVQKDITKQYQQQNKNSAQIAAITKDLSKTEQKALDKFRKKNEEAKKAENLAKSLADKQKQGAKITDGQVKRAQELAVKKAEQLAIEGAQLSNQAEQIVFLEQANREVDKNLEYLAQQLKFQENLKMSQSGLIGMMGNLGKIFDKIGMSKTGAVLTKAFENAKQEIYEASDGGKRMIGGLEKASIAAKNFGSAILKATGPLALLGLAVTAFKKMRARAKEAADAIMATGQATADLGRDLGISGEKAAEVASQAVKVSKGMGMTTIQAKQAAGSILSAMDGTEKMTDKTLKSFMKLQKFAKMSGDDLKQIRNLSKLTGQDAGDTANEMAKQAQSSIKNLKLNTSMRSLMQSVGKVSSNIKLNFAGSAKGITAAVAQAKKLGLEMSQVEGIASSLLNIEDSLAAEMEAELLTGKELNLEKARAAALNGDQVALMDELAKQGITQADYANMNVLQQDALAKSLGMNREQMADMLVKQKENTAENTSMVDMQREGIEAMQGLVSELERKAALEEASKLKLEESGKQYIAFEKAVIKLQDAFAPLMEKIMPGIVEFVTYIVNGVTDVINKFSEGSGFVDTFMNKLTGTQKIVVAIGAGFVAIRTTLFAIQTIQKGINAYKKIQNALDRTQKMFITFKHNMGKKQLVIYAKEKAAKLGQKALDAASFLKQIGIAAMKAISSLASIPVVGYGLGIAAAAGVAALAAKYMNDGVQGPVSGGKPGYSRTMFGPEGAISFNDKDTIVAGTNLGGGGGNNNNNAELARISNLLEQLLNKEGGVYIDGNKVGSTIALTNYEQQ